MTLERGTRDTMPFQRLVFHLMILMNWTLTFNSVFSAETENFNLEEQINQKFLDLKLSDSVFDYQVDEQPVEPFNQNNSNNQIILSLNHLSKTIYTNPPFKIPIFEELGTWKRYWIKGVIDHFVLINYYIQLKCTF